MKQSMTCLGLVVAGCFLLFHPLSSIAVQKRYTPEELAFLNGVGGFGDVGTLDCSRQVVSPRSRLGFSLKIVWEDHPGPPGWWSIRTGLPDSAVGCDRFAFDLYVEHAEGATLNVFLYESDDDRWVCWTKRLDEVPARRWHHFETPKSRMRMWYIGNHRAQWERLRGLALEVSGGKAVFHVDCPVLSGPSKRVDIFTAADDGFRPVSGWKGPPALPEGTGFSYFPFDASRLDDERLLHTPLGLARVLEQVGAPISGYGPNSPGQIRFFVEHGIQTVHYSGLASGYQRYITRRGGWGVREDGVTPNATPLNILHVPAVHAVCLSHPAVREALKKKVEALAAAGFGAWEMVDYVMPYWGGLWGYAPAAVAAYREDLAGKDAGLRFPQGETVQTVRFPDYFRLYNGWFPEPADVGLRSWEAFSPPRPRDAKSDENARRRLEMFMWLRTYEWLKTADMTGRAMQAAGGQGLWIVPNPEDSYGSPDYVGLVRCAGVVNLFPEWFGPIGWAAEAGYASLPYLRREADEGRTRLSIIQETGAGGHSAPYLDWRVAYTGVYALTAAGRLDDFDNDFIDHVPFEQMSDPTRNTREFVRFRDAAAKALAFRAARSDGARRPAARILCIGSRPPCLAEGSIFFGLGRRYIPAVGLARARVVFDLRDDFDLDASDLAPYSMVVYAPWAPRVGDLAMLREWVSRGDRILVTHTFVPTRRASGFWRLRRSTAIGDGNAGKVLGLGRIQPGTAKRLRVETVRSPWNAAFRKGEVLEFPDALFRMDGGADAVSGDAGRLISEMPLGKGQIVYLHYVPGSNDAVQRLDARVMRVLAAECGVRPVCDAEFGLLTQVFEIDGGLVVAAWSGGAMGRWHWEYRAGIAPMRYEADGVDGTVHVPVSGKSGTIVYDFLDGRVRRTPAGKKTLDLRLKDRICALFYVLDDTPEGRRRLTALRERRLEMSRLHFDEIGMQVR